MEGENRSSLKLNGAGSASGGIYDEVRINGAGSINGDTDCFSLDTNGASDIKGNVKARTIKTNGTSQIRGNVICEDIEVNGTLSIKDGMETGRLKIQGAVDMGGGLHASEVDIKGALRTKGDCEAENFKCIGGFDIDGLLNAGNISIDIGGNCRAKEIGGEKIEVKRSGNFVFQLQRIIKDIFNVKEYLNAETIEGDDIYLEATNAKVVRGNNINIGSDCIIELVEYKKQMTMSNNSKVIDNKKI